MHSEGFRGLNFSRRERLGKKFAQRTFSAPLKKLFIISAPTYGAGVIIIYRVD